MVIANMAMRTQPIAMPGPTLEEFSVLESLSSVIPIPTISGLFEACVVVGVCHVVDEVVVVVAVVVVVVIVVVKVVEVVVVVDIGIGMELFGKNPFSTRHSVKSALVNLFREHVILA